MSALASLLLILSAFFGHHAALPSHHGRVVTTVDVTGQALLLPENLSPGEVLGERAFNEKLPQGQQLPANPRAVLTADVRPDSDQPRIYRLRLGDGYSTIVARYHVTMAAVQAANPWVRDQNDLPVGYPVIVPPKSWSPPTEAGTPSDRGENTTPDRGGNTTPAAEGYAPVPVGNAAMWECIERAESSDNPRSVNQLPGGSGGGLFGDLSSTWSDYAGYPEPYDAPVSVQVQFNAQLYREDGYQPWDDPCTGRNGA